MQHLRDFENYSDLHCFCTHGYFCVRNMEQLEVLLLNKQNKQLY